MKDFFGLDMGAVPADFIGKWQAYFSHFSTISRYAVAIGLGTSFDHYLFFSKITHVVPGSLVATLVATVAVQLFHLPVETIGSRFGSIPSSLPLPSVPRLDWAVIKASIQPAFTIAILGGIESLLSAVVADGMIGGNHKSNMEPWRRAALIWPLLFLEAYRHRRYCPYRYQY